MLHRSASDNRLAPMFDVVTTAIYRYTQYAGGPELKDRTLALKLLAGKGATKAYPTTEALLAFGSRVCNVRSPAQVLARIAQAMGQALHEAAADARIPAGLLGNMKDVWAIGMDYARA